MSKSTIHNMDPVGFGLGAPSFELLHLVLTVANPKSPIFTVVPSAKKILLVLRSLKIAKI